MIIAALTFSLIAAGSPYKPLPSGPVLARSALAKAACKEIRLSAKGSTAGQSNLPFAMGRRFRTLDEYLTHLQCRAGPIGLPWYKQLKGNVFELQSGNVRKLGSNGTEQKRIFTRIELAKKFGFVE